jgi:FlaA1/EpsC-like NDP-sugar epimerase
VEELMLRLRPHRPFLLSSFDLVCWLVSFTLLGWLQIALNDSSPGRLRIAVAVGALCGVLFLLVGWSMRLHQGRAQLGTFEDAVLVVTVTGIVSAVEIVGYVLVGRGHSVNGSLAVTGPLLAFALMIWARGLFRVLHDRSAKPRSTGRLTPVVVAGAGEGGRQLVMSMLRDPTSQWRPVALVDDDPLKRHRRIRGVPVLGATGELAHVAAQVGATTAIIAIPSASSDTIRGLSGMANDAGLDLKVVPSTSQLLNPTEVAISDVRDLHVTDLLGRHVIDTDVSSIAGYLTDRRVLVTGAGGSIGSELCRQISRFGPAELIMLDRDESALHAVQLSIYGKAMLDTDDVVLGDIRDAQFVIDLFERRRPQVVFHAAALKHLPLLERAPGEAVKTNIWGTLTILEAAAAAGVERFVNISTDKAANPCSVLGYSKRLAEGLTASVASDADGTFMSVRFGNVLGSRGSVLAAFTAQIAAGGPITVTDPCVTRYFMTIEEAVQLVIQAAAIGRDGEALVLDMGEPVSIDSVARQLIELSGKDIAIQYTGLRNGEKMHEELLGDGESDARPVHALISQTRVPPFHPLDARALDAWCPSEELVKTLRLRCEVLSHAVFEMRAARALVPQPPMAREAM